MNRPMLVLFAGAALCLQIALADAPLKTALGLSIEQARQVDQIQAEYRPKFAAKRTERDREMRRFRRAKIANDSKQMAELEKVTDVLNAQLKQIRMNEDEEIRKVLNADQKKKFEDYIKLRAEMVGSSREHY